MAKTKISEFSSTASSNTDIDSINIAEGCAPSGINDAIRELMAQLKDFQTGAQGDSFNGPVGTTTAAAGAFTTLSASSTVTLSGGTANGVTYLNGSKVLTSGSALTFDGSKLEVTTTDLNSAFLTNSATTGATTGSGLGFKAYNGTSVTQSAGIFLTANSWSYGTFSANQLSIGSDGTGGLALRTANSAPIAFFTGGATAGVSTEAMRLTSTGLGIGTSSPANKLDVNNTSGSTTGGIRVYATDQAYARLNIQNANGQAWHLVAGTPGASNSGLSIYNATSSTNVAQFDSSGNLGLGVTPSAGGATSNYRLFEIGLDGGGSIYSASNQNLIGTNISWVGGTAYYKTTSRAPVLYNQQNGVHSWSTAPTGTAGNAITFTQAMSLTADGNLLLGATSELYSCKFLISGNSATYNFIVIKDTATSFPDNNYQTFLNSSDAVAGKIVHTGSTTVSYTTSSDYRLKDITGPITTSGDYIDSLNPVEGTWKTDGSTFVGLIAHEVQESSRTKIATGTKDGDQMQTMDYSSSELIANLIAEVKSLRQRVATLEAK